MTIGRTCVVLECMGQLHKVGGADETGEYAVVASHVNQCNHLHACS